MRHLSKISLLSSIAVILMASLSTSAVSAKKAQRLLVGGCAWDKVAVINKSTGEVEWSHTINPGEDCNDVQMTRKGNVLYAYNSGARMISFKDQSVIWDYKAPKGCELFTATELHDGRFMLAMCGTPSRIVELDRNGVQINEITFDTGIENVHSQFRQIVLNDKGNYVIPLMGRGDVIEMTPAGETLLSVKTRGNHFSVKILHNGNWLVSCGDGHRFVEIDPATGEEVRVVGTKDLDSHALLFVGEIQPLANGNVIVSNWPGHSKDKNQPRLMEIDPAGKVVWKLMGSDKIGSISSVSLIK